MNKKILTFLIFLLTPFVFVSADADSAIQNFSMSEGYMNFQTEIPSKTNLFYLSQDGQIKVELIDSVYRQTHNIQLWDLEFFTEFDYTLNAIDYKGNVDIKEGTFKVVPADPDLYIELEKNKKRI